MVRAVGSINNLAKSKICQKVKGLLTRVTGKYNLSNSGKPLSHFETGNPEPSLVLYISRKV